MEKILSLELMLLLNAIIVAIILFQIFRFWKGRNPSQFQEELWKDPKFRSRVEEEIDFIALESPLSTKGEKARKKKKATKKTPFQRPNFFGQAHEILGLRKNPSKEEVEAAYRYWIKRYHPDRVEHMGVAYIRQANKRSESLNQARATLLSQLSNN